MSEKGGDDFSSPRSLSDTPLDDESVGDSPFPDGNPDSLSPSSSSFAVFTKEQDGSSSSAPDPHPSTQTQDSVIVIDEAVPRGSLGSGEDDEVPGERDTDDPPRPPSPSRTCSITDEEALGVSTEVHPPSDDLLEPHFEVLDIVGKEEREGGRDHEVGRKKDRNKTTGSVKKEGVGGSKRESFSREKGREREGRRNRDEDGKEERNDRGSELAVSSLHALSLSLLSLPLSSFLSLPLSCFLSLSLFPLIRWISRRNSERYFSHYL
jgi:hypothetical protein